MNSSKIVLLLALCLVAAYSQTASQCTANQDCYSKMDSSAGVGYCCGNLTNCGTRKLSYASTCYKPGSLTATSANYAYNSTTNCTQTCFAYTGLSATPSNGGNGGTNNNSTDGTVALGGICTESTDCAGHGDSICCGEYDMSEYKPDNRFDNVNTTTSTNTNTVYVCVGDSYLSTMNTASYTNSSYYVKYERTCSNAYIM